KDSEVEKPGQVPLNYGEQNNLQDFEKSDKSESLSVWSAYNLDEEVKHMIKEQNPDMVIEYENFSTFEITEEYAKAYNDGTAPDVIIIDPFSMGSFNSTNAFENLEKSPYNAEAMLSKYPKHLKGAFRSFDDKKLLALPVEVFPCVTFYRYDIIKQAGFPAEPEDLAVFMKDTENWLEMAKKFRENEQYIVSWHLNPLLYADLSSNVFDSELRYIRNYGIFTEMLKLSNTIDSLDLASSSRISMNVEEGNSLETGKTVMFQNSMRYINVIKEATKGKTDGKWRMTHLPFGLNAWSESAVAVISSESNNKEAAWGVVKLLANRHIDKMDKIMDPDKATNIYKYTVFGEQDIDSLYRKLIEDIPEYHFTPLDEKAREIWWDEVTKDNSSSTSFTLTIHTVSQTVIRELEEDITILREILKNN
ncbi:extracellular solute-binding protein, partial [Herbivorax sp. ANBcel31]|uniref:ABC transporter substrate-binding protein n=1 Tax=Herbivorax sp. ANBcel31 TaxID=3069754 RepID=UPI0027B1AD3D